MIPVKHYLAILVSIIFVFLCNFAAGQNVDPPYKKLKIIWESESYIPTSKSIDMDKMKNTGDENHIKMLKRITVGICYNYSRPYAMFYNSYEIDKLSKEEVVGQNIGSLPDQAKEEFKRQVENIYSSPSRPIHVTMKSEFVDCLTHVKLELNTAQASNIESCFYKDLEERKGRYSFSKNEKDKLLESFWDCMGD
jgi:hypothetical protein